MSANLTPWVRGRLCLLPEAMAALRAHAERDYPDECCGFLCGPAAQPEVLDQALEAVNQADRYHREDPERHPKSARTSFAIDALVAARLFDEQRAHKRPIKVIYHSHCDAGAYFSSEDATTFSQGGQLMWPCAFIVLSVMRGRLRDVRLWVHVPDSDEFRPSPLLVLGSQP